MSLEAITADTLEQALRAFQQAAEPPRTLLDLLILGDTGSPIERSIRLHGWLAQHTIEQLDQLRQAEGLPLKVNVAATREALLNDLAGDFHRDNPDLKAWSALFFRYFTPFALPISDLADAVDLVERQFRRYIHDGLAHLVALLHRAEVAATRQAHLCGLHLPPPEFARLYGVDDLITRVALHITADTYTPLISLEGLGGIGKTALARAVAQRLAESGDFVDIIWISARHEYFDEDGAVMREVDPARSVQDIVTRLVQAVGLDQTIGWPTAEKLNSLYALFTRRAYFIIIDNLETVADSELLIPELRRLAGLTRFLLTSRTTLRRFPYVQIFAVPELSRPAAETLLMGELARQDRNEEISEAELHPLYDVIGGLPLALKLVAAQLGHLSFSAVLENLRAAKQTPENLYNYIYRHTWELLDDTARVVLVEMMRLSPEGEDAEFLRGFSGLAAPEFDNALIQLRHYSLVEITGRLSAPRYHLHRLTVTFLQSDLLQRWNK